MRALPWSPQDFAPGLAIELLVMQPTPFCNIACDYCYLAERDAVRFMSVDVVRAAIRNARDSGLLGRELDIVWHAGEPLAAPVSFYERAFDIIDEEVGTTVPVRHSMQTNGMLIDERWCELFVRYGVHVGVSVDGPAGIHDRHRRTRDGRPTHARVMQGIERLQRAGVDFDALAVVTDASLERADDIIDFFLDSGIVRAGFNVDEQEGIRTGSSLTGADSRVRAFFTRVFERAADVPERLRIREMHEAVGRVATGLPIVTVAGRPLPANPQVLPFATTTVDCEGRFSCFSPELIDQTHADYGSFVFGDVLNDRMIDALASDRFAAVFDDILAGCDACRAACPYFSLCGGGAPVNKLNEGGSFRIAETRYCRQTIQTPIELAMAALEAELLPEHRPLTID
ncbi:MAG: GRRM system radical SAM/SPASM domain protein [Burkholderiales bacterium]|nr:GRRM system radical SAM/SPASM domain protein [Burkholderiales bacterium]